jgi:hypothetical protein
MRGIHAPRITQALPAAVTDSRVRLGRGGESGWRGRSAPALRIARIALTSELRASVKIRPVGHQAGGGAVPNG